MDLVDKVFEQALDGKDFMPEVDISENYKHWISKEDIKRCVECAKMHGKIWTKDEEASVDLFAHPNCRCSIEQMQTIRAGTATINKENGADFVLKKENILPEYYLTEDEAVKLGYRVYLGNLGEVAPGHMLAKGVYKNRNNHLPMIEGRQWYEADINYIQGFRGPDRILFSNDSLIFVTYDHYNTFFEIID